MNTGNRRGACQATGKVCYQSRDAAKRHQRRTRMRDVVAYKCEHGNHFHLGGWHGIKDRAAHREGIGTMTINQAAQTLGTSTDFVYRLMNDGKVRSENGHPYRADIERILDSEGA